MCRASRASTLSIASRHGPKPPTTDALREVHVHAVVDRVAGDDQLEIRDVQDAGVVAVGVADLDDHEVVPFEREAVVRHRHRGDRRRRDARVHLVPEQRPPSDVGVHLRDRPRRGDDACPEPFGQQPGGEPVIAVAVGDEDVGEVPALAGDPVAERARLICRHPGVGQHRVLAPVDQRAGLRGEQLRLAVRQEPSWGGGSLTKTS